MVANDLLRFSGFSETWKLNAKQLRLCSFVFGAVSRVRDAIERRKRTHNKEQKVMMTKFRNLLKSKNGATAIEYGLIAALIGVVIISAVTALGTTIESQFNNIEKAIKAPTP